MTLKEFQLKMKCYQLRLLDKRQTFIEEQFIKRAIQAQKEAGNKLVYVYKKPEQIFDYQKEVDMVLGVQSETTEQLFTIAKRLKDRRQQ